MSRLKIVQPKAQIEVTLPVEIRDVTGYGDRFDWYIPSPLGGSLDSEFAFDTYEEALEDIKNTFGGDE